MVRVASLWAGTLALGLGLGGVAVAASSASTGKVIPGAAYSADETLLTVDVAGKTVTIQQLPAHAQCTGGSSAGEGDYGEPGLGPFTIAADGTFTNVAKGAKPGATQGVIKGRFTGATVTGTILEPAFSDKGTKCEKYSGKWSATRQAGTGDDAAVGDTYATDDFSDPASGFDTYNEDAAYAEYLTDGRYRIGLRAPALAAALRAEPVTASADVSVDAAAVSATGADRAGLACDATAATSYIVGWVTQDGKAYISRYVDGNAKEISKGFPLPSGLLKTGEGAMNKLRLTCVPGPRSDTTSVKLYLNGKQVARGVPSALAAGTTGVMVTSTTGTPQFAFYDFAVKKAG